MSRRWRAAVGLACALALTGLVWNGLELSAMGQNTNTFGNISTGAAGCGSANCVYYQLPPQTAWVVVTATGNWTGTLNVYTVSAPNANNANLNNVAWTPVAAETANGSWTVATSGDTFLLVSASSWTSGVARVTMTLSPLISPLTNPVLPGTVTGNALSLIGAGCVPGSYAKADGTGCGPAGGGGLAAINSQTGPNVNLQGDSTISVTPGSPSANDIQLHVLGTGSAAVQYNPATTAYVFATSSIVYDDNHAFSPAASVLSYTVSGSGAGETTEIHLSAALTSNPVPAAGTSWFQLSAMTGWATCASVQGLWCGTFPVKTVVSSTDYILSTPNTAAPGCSASCGTVYDATAWAIIQAADTPYLYGHGTVYGVESALSNLDTNFATLVNCSLGNPTYLILVQDQDDLLTLSAPTIESHYTSVWNKAVAAGCKVITSSFTAAGYGLGNVVSQPQAQIDGWLLTQFDGLNSNMGEYLDLNNLNQVQQSFGLLGTSSQAAYVFAQDLNQVFVNQGRGAPHNGPLWENLYSGGLGATQMALGINANGFTPSFAVYDVNDNMVPFFVGPYGVVVAPHFAGGPAMEVQMGQTVTNGTLFCEGAAGRISDELCQGFNYVADQSALNYGRLGQYGAASDSYRIYGGGANWFGYILAGQAGAAIPAAATIAPTNEYFHITTSATTINTITVPFACTITGSMCTIRPTFDVAAPLGTAGNIAVALTPQVGTVVPLTYDPATLKWYPSGGSSGGSGSGTVISGASYAFAAYGSAAAAQVQPSNIGTDSTGNNLNVPGKGSFGAGSATVLNVTSQTIATLPATGNTTGDQREVSDGATAYDCTTGAGTTIHWCDWSGTAWVSDVPTGTMVYPAAGLAVSTGTAWGASLTAPASALVGVSDTQTLLNKSIDASEIASGALPAARMPALTGDCTTSAGAVATNCAHAFTTLTDAAPIAWTATGDISNAKVTLAHTTATRAINISGLASGDYGTLVVLQDATGGAYLTGGTGCTWYVGGASGYTASTTFFSTAPAANQVNIIAFVYDGTNCYANVR